MGRKSKSPLGEVKKLKPSLLCKKSCSVRDYVEIGLKIVPYNIIRSAWEFSEVNQHQVIPERIYKEFSRKYPREILEVFWNEETSDYIFNNDFGDHIVAVNLTKAITLTASDIGYIVEDIIEDGEDYDCETDIFELAYSRLIEKMKTDKNWHRKSPKSFSKI